MIGHKSLIESAFELAATGQYAGISDIRQQLRALGFPSPEIKAHLTGKSVRRQLAQITLKARTDG